MSKVIAYVGSFVVGAPSQITLTDPDGDDDLKDYTEISVLFTPKKGSAIPWPVVSRTPIWSDGPVDPQTGKPTQVVNTLVLKVIPALPPPGCLGWFLPPFPRWRRKHRLHDDPIGTGTLSGTLNKPQNPPDPLGPGHARDTLTIVPIENPLIFYGTLA